MLIMGWNDCKNLNKKDTIEMVKMPGDEGAVPKGTKGVVKSVSFYATFATIAVEWENESKAVVSIPPDTIRKVD